MAFKIYLSRRTRVAMAAMVLLLAGAEWTLFKALELASISLPAKLFWNKLQFLGVAILPITWLVFTIFYTGHDKWLKQRTLAIILGVIPLATLLMVFTNDGHGLIWSRTALISEGSIALLDHTFGPGMWVFLAHSYILFFLGTALFLQRLLWSRHLYLWQISGLLFAGLIVGLANIIGLSRLPLFKAFGATPLAFSIVAVAAAMSYSRLKQLDVVPGAREAILENMGEGIMVLDARNNVVDLNLATQRLMGCTPSEAIGQPLHQVWPEWFRQMLPPYGGPEARKEIVLKKEGENRTHEVHFSPLMDWRNRIYGQILVMRDITDMVRGQEALRESEERYRIAIESYHDGVAMIRGDRYLFVNKKFAEIFGYDRPEEIIGKPCSLVVAPDELERVATLTPKTQNGLPAPLHFEFKGVRKEGKTVEIEVSTASVTYRGETVSLAYFKDITEQKWAERGMMALEEQLRHSQKMEAVGLLAGGIAHDFNNLLMLIFGNIELGRIKVEQSHPLYDILNKIQESSQKASVLTQKLLAFSRRQMLQPKVLDTAKLIRNFSETLNRIIGEDIELSMKLGRNLGHIYVDAVSFEQVFMNLVVNARDAMPQGGALSIQVQNIQLDDKFCKLHPYVRRGDYVMISLKDTGIGMDQPTLQRIFDPFFTTKEQGTGLGLAVAYGIVKQHKGYIIASSQLGQGTRFDIYFPMNKGPVSEEPLKLAEESIPHGKETLLMAEDEKEVREMFGTFLQELGYKVFLASDGEEALRVFSNQYQALDLVIMDAVMPKISGPKVYDQMRSLRPDLPCLFLTGYSKEIVHKHFEKNFEIHVLRKPITFKELGRKVREALDQADKKKA